MNNATKYTALGYRFGNQILCKRQAGKRALGDRYLGKRMCDNAIIGERILGSRFMGARSINNLYWGKTNFTA